MTVTQEGMGVLIDMQALGWLGGILAIILTFVWEKLGKKFKPWSWLLNWIGSRINASINKRLTTIEDKVDKLEKADAQQDARNAEQRALDARRHIIAAADELRRGVEHSEEWFNSVLEDCTGYKRYCTENPDFQNEKAVRSMQYIENTYDKVYAENKFI